MKITLYIAFFFLVSFSINKTYIRYTDLPHSDLANLMITNETKDSIKFKVTFGRQDSLTSEFYTFNLTDTNFRYLENKKVIQFQGSYFIRANVKNKEIFKTYYNRDVEF